MSSSYVSRHGAGALAALAALIAVLVTVPRDTASTQGPRAVVQNPVEPPRSIGDAPLPVPESRVVVLQSTPEELLASVIAARGRGDLAALARCSSTSAGRPALDQLDTARAERDFVDGDEIWKRIEAAKAARTLRVEQAKQAAKQKGDPIEATGSFVAPSAGRGSASAGLAELQIPIVCIRGAWFVRVSP